MSGTSQILLFSLCDHFSKIDIAIHILKIKFPTIFIHISLSDIYYTTKLPAFKDKRKVQICTRAIEVNMVSDTKDREKGDLSGLRIQSKFPRGINI